MKFNHIRFEKFFVVIVSVILGLYALFLLLPFIVSPIINSYSDEISDVIKESTGYEAKIEGLGVSTSVNFSAGLKVKELSLYTPDDTQKAFFKINNARIRLALLPLLTRKIQLQDAIVDDLDVSLKVKDGGALTIFDFLKQNQKQNGEIPEMISLPWGFELSNTLPNVKINDYKFEFIDIKTSKSYYLEGEDLYIRDFVLDKHVKVSTKGKIVFDEDKISDFDIKIYNKIMPDIKLQDIVFPKNDDKVTQKNNTAQSFDMPFNIIEIFNKVKQNGLRANIIMDVKTSGSFKNPSQRGHFKIENLSVKVNGKQLPESYADLNFKGDKTDIDSIIFTSEDEKENTQVIGNIHSGKKKSIDLTLRTNAKINNIIRLIDSIAQSVGINDFKTLSATGSINADFNINSDMKKVLSNGYLKINPSSIKYGLYNINIDNITADVNLDNNYINIKKSGFSVFSHPLRLSGSITPEAYVDLKLNADNIDLRALLTTAGQSALLKGYNLSPGVLSAIANVKGKLDAINFDLNVNGNLKTSWIMNFIPSDVRNLFPYAGALPFKLFLKGDVKTQNIIFEMNADNANYIKFADINLLKGKTTKIYSNMKYNADVLTFNNAEISTVDGKIATMSGNIAKLLSSPKLNLNINVPKQISFPVWGMGNSNITASGSVLVSGNVENPNIKGQVKISDLSVKDLDFGITNLYADINGKVLTGKAKADKFYLGNIVGTNLSSDFSLKNYTDFYLDNLMGDAFDGKINGKISYNIPTTSIGFKMSGKDLNSTKAIYGAVGIKNALTGILNFNTNLKMRGITDKEIIKSMTGNFDFNIDDGRFMSIGRFENLVAAQNIESISILKSAISALSTLSIIQQTDSFKNINGSMNFSNGSADITKINVSGPLMSYYVKGIYNILPNTANLVILGRLDSKVVSVLGVVGELSAEKLLSYIPKIGAATAQFLQIITQDPLNENTALIPALSTGSTSYKDFKVIFNGSVESSRSVKTFKWLSKCDTSKINIKQDLQEAKKNIKNNINNQINAEKAKAQNIKNNVNKIVETKKQAVQEQKQALEQTKSDLEKIKTNAPQSAINLGKLFLNAAQNASKPINTTNKEEIKE